MNHFETKLNGKSSSKCLLNGMTNEHKVSDNQMSNNKSSDNEMSKKRLSGKKLSENHDDSDEETDSSEDTLPTEILNMRLETGKVESEFELTLFSSFNLADFYPKKLWEKNLVTLGS